MRVLSGARTPEPWRAAARALADLLADAALVELDAGWLSPVEAPGALSRAITMSSEAS